MGGTDNCTYADINGDGVVDASDYITLKRNYGASTGNCTRSELLCAQSSQEMEIPIVEIPKVQTLQEQAEEFCSSIDISLKKDNNKCRKADFLNNEKKNPKDCKIKKKKCVARLNAD